MAEYIPREALMDCIELNAREYGKEYDAWQILGDVEDFAAADVVEVVRCKDCKHRKRLRYDGWYHCGNEDAGMATGVVLKDSDFCSYGERRNDA